MIALSGAVLLPDRLLSPGTLVVEDGRIAEVRPDEPPGAVSLHGHYLAPGFIDVHVHGVGGLDTLDQGNAIAEIAVRLPRYGVTAFCPTTVACEPAALRRVLRAVREARAAPPRGARVLAAHLESNFINPDYRGAQPLDCLRLPPRTIPEETRDDGAFTGEDVLREIDAHRAEVGIVTLAPELPGGRDVIAHFVGHGHRVSLGHSAATYEQALDAIEAGARHATHLFNRMPPIHHREPGLAGAALASDAIVAEVICDGHHVHPAMVRAAIAAKRPSGIMAITDGTAGSGLPTGARARLGGRAITVTALGARLDDGTLAGSVLTMDGAFRMLVECVELSLTDAALVCSTTPARQLGLPGHGVLAPGMAADFVVLNRRLEVVQTYVGGTCLYSTL